MGQDDRADIASVHDDAVFPRDALLRIQQESANRRQGAHGGGVQGNLVFADAVSQIFAVEEDVLHAVHVPDLNVYVTQFIDHGGDGGQGNPL